MVLRNRLDAEKTLDTTESAHFNFTDLDEHFVLKVNYCIYQRIYILGDIKGRDSVN